MIKIKPRHIVSILVLLVLVLGTYVGWQIYKGQQIAKQYTSDTQKFAQGSVNGSASSNSLAPSPGTSSAQTPSQASSQNPSSQTGDSPINPNLPYKQLMSSPYQQTLQAMQNIKNNTLALQGNKISIFDYKASILQAQATFTSAEAFVQANPPTEEKLKAPYQEFLAGISLAKEAMNVVLNGMSPSSLYAAREMGLNAKRQVIDAYAHF
ncbi:MAG: hypothetical protein ACYDEJ_11715 [Desulfitobacteriaceae bacterium]